MIGLGANSQALDGMTNVTEPPHLRLLNDDETVLPSDEILEDWSDAHEDMSADCVRAVSADTLGAFFLGVIETPIESVAEAQARPNQTMIRRKPAR